MTEESTKEKIKLGIVLKGDMKKRFLSVKNHWGLENNTDVIRMLITREYEKIIEKKEG